MSPALAQFDSLIDLLVEVVVREIENESAPEAGKPAGRKEKIDDNRKSTSPEG